MYSGVERDVAVRSEIKITAVFFVFFSFLCTYTHWRAIFAIVAKIVYEWEGDFTFSHVLQSKRSVYAFSPMSPLFV